MTDKERKLLSRRDTIRLFGLTAAGVATAAVVGCGDDDGADGSATSSATTGASATATAAATSSAATATPTAAPTTIPTTVGCVVTPELTEGPYFVDERLLRSDITTDPDTGAVSAGIPLALTVIVSNFSTGCEAISGAAVDMWHCDAAGEYSDISGGAGQGNTAGTKFLRGYQLTDANGQAQFQTIFPGWYSGRAIHIHFKVRTDPDSSSGYEFTSQFFFDESVIDTVLAQEPYAAKGAPNVRNATDNIYTPEMLITLAQQGSGYSGSYHVGVNFA